MSKKDKSQTNPTTGSGVSDPVNTPTDNHRIPSSADTMHGPKQALPTLQVVLSGRTFPDVIDPLWSIFENIQIYIAYLDPKGNFIQVNRNFAEALGKKPEELKGVNALDLNPNPQSRELFEQAVHAGRSFSANNVPIFDPDHPERGTTYWNWTLNPLFEPDGTVNGLLFAANEVTTRVHAEQSLKETQALFELIFESAPDANILVDENGTMIAVNHQTEILFDYRRSELLGKAIEMLIPENFHDRQPRQWDEHIASPHTHSVDAKKSLVGVRKGGGEIPLSITLSPLKINDRVLVLNVVRDLTEQLRAEKMIRSSEARLHAIFDNAAIGIQLLDASGRLLDTNPAMQNMLGYSGEELSQMSFLDFTFEGDVKRNLELFGSLLEEKIESYRMEKRYRRKDGSLFWGRQHVSRFISDPDKPPFVIVMVEDITELKQAEAALRESEERFRSSVETLVDGFAILSPVRNKRGHLVDFRYEFINDAGCQLNQLSRDEHLGHTLLELQPIYKENGLLKKFIELVECGEPVVLDSFKFIDKVIDGERVFKAYDIQAVKMDEGLAMSWSDITGRKIAEESLDQQEKLLRRVVETLPVGVWITDKHGAIQYGNQAGRHIWGYVEVASVEQYREFKGWWVSTGERLKHEEWAVQRALLKGETVIEDEIIVETMDGSHKTVLNSAAPILDEQGQINGAILVNQDITERKQMQAELAEVQHKLLRQAEEDRASLARDMHDGPIQDLYGVSFLLDELEHSTDKDNSAELMEKTRTAIQQTIATLRTLMSDLRPPTLAPFGLERTIRSYVEQYQQKHPEINLHLNLMKDGQKLAEEHRLALFRILQEALNNVRRHSQAKNVFINFSFDDEDAFLVIEDDGVGFEVPRHWVTLAREGHYGLVGMRERVEALHGHMDIFSHPGQGTQYQISVPLRGEGG